MNEKALHTLEYDKIIEKLVGYAVSPMAKERAAALRPSAAMSDIIIWQEETTEATTMVLKKGTPSFGGFREIRPQLKRASMAGILSIAELMSVGEFAYVCRKVKNYARKENKDEVYARLDEYFDLITPLDKLENEISRCILSETEVADDASAGLRSVRREIKASNERVKDHLNGVINSSAYRNMLQDFVITIRNDRYCVPVKAEYRSSFPGMIHDQSNTGSTLFMEPLSVIQLNNKIKELQAKEKEEIEKILIALSDMVTANAFAIEGNLELLTQLDFIFAKANLSLAMDGTQPLFNTKGYINIHKGRHPLLDPKKVVPTDIYLGKDFTTLMITGPNTGGKTVALKTLGLFTLMGQAGLHIPAFDNSQLAVFDNVFASIGDEQSIEQSLSTFSAHMTNIVKIMDEVTDDSLVLFDELGAGTDPTEGAALAVAIIQALLERKIRTAVTTHYSELKVFALTTEGVENACCEFDVETLRPTYRLLIGIPGKSNAFAISSKLGLPDYIINKAKDEISEQDESFEDVLTTLEQNRITLEREKEELARTRAEVESLKQSLAKNQEQIDARKEKMISDATEEAQRILREAKEYADQTMRDFQKFGKENVSVREMEQKRTALREKMNKLDKKKAKEVPKRTGNLRPQDLHLGDAVKVLSMNLKGTVSTRPDSKGNLFVQMGIMRTKVHISDLVLIDEAVITGPSISRTSSGKSKLSKAATISTEINLLGKTVDEAVAELDKYLDDAYLSHLPSVRVVHGKGTGALRKGIHNYLRRQKHVADFHLAEFGEGDAGVTIVTFKK
mgnify:CR=1 FL=1